jgi:prephenate dehydratase
MDMKPRERWMEQSGIGPDGEESWAVAFQGEPGAFSEEALGVLLPGRSRGIPCSDFAAVGRAVESGGAQLGLLPVENSLAGSVLGSYDVLLRAPLDVIGEVVLPIRHMLMGIPGSTVDGLREIRSHPVALAQCTRFLGAHDGIRAVAAQDTAGSAREVAEWGDPGVAAIAPEGAAERYGLEVLARDLQDRDDNQTRFFLVAPRDPQGRAPRPILPPGPGCVALVVETGNRPGALVDALLPFARRGINLSKLESRPGDVPWTYRFFLELSADLGEAAVQEAIEEVEGRARTLRILGSFPGAPRPFSTGGPEEG